MTYAFVQAAFDYGPRPGPARAFVIHMAEGGGTVGYLSGQPARGVSIHYVIESSGRIVQMLKEDHASGSINPQEIRTTDDPDGFYGVTAAKAVMGSYWQDPNLAVISVEIEGFAAAGPSPVQRTSLRILVDDVRSRYSAIGLLGHRDFAAYKACPGKLIPWPELGGHGPAEAPMQTFWLDPKAQSGTLVVTGADHAYFALSDGKLHGPIDPVAFGTRRCYGPVELNPPVPNHPGEPWYLIGTAAAFVRVQDCIFTPDPPPVVSCDDVVTVELNAAAERAALAVRTRP